MSLHTMYQVLADLPVKSDVILYTGLSSLQKKYYKAILMKDLGIATFTRCYLTCVHYSVNANCPHPNHTYLILPV